MAKTACAASDLVHDFCQSELMRSIYPIPAGMSSAKKEGVTYHMLLAYKRSVHILPFLKKGDCYSLLQTKMLIKDVPDVRST